MSAGPRVNAPPANHLPLPDFRGEAVLLGQGHVEGAKRYGISGKEVRGEPGKDRDILGADDTTRLSRRQDSALGPFSGVGANRPSNLEMLYMPVFVPTGVFD